MTLLFRAASAGFRAAVAPMARAFRRDLDDPEEAQERLLRQLTGDDYATFAAKTPIVCYDDLLQGDSAQCGAGNPACADSVDPALAHSAGEIACATLRPPEPVLFYEMTSGSTAASKRIPYTRSLRDSFHRMFLLWLYDILENGPRLDTGRFVMSVSPSADSDDLHFLRGPLAALLRRFIIEPPRSVAPALLPVPAQTGVSVPHLHEFRRRVGRALVDGKPEVISIWNPSYLLLALDEIGKTSLDSVKLISCWASANAASGADALRARFPNAMLQPKGLLATEAPVTIPLFEADGFVPLLNEVFIELEDDSGRIIRLHEAIDGGEYSLIISQKGGLLRYRLGDRVRVTHRYRQTPCLDIIGRCDDVSDLVGEKLSEGLAQSVVRAITRGYGVVLPQIGDPSYVVVVESSDLPDELLSRRADAELMNSHRYREARLLGQLAPASVRVVPNAEARVLDYFVGKGMKIGDIKPLALIRNHADAEALNRLLQETHAPAVQ